MTSPIIQLPPHMNMTVEEALALCARTHARYSDVMIIGYDAEDGHLVTRSSHMSRAEATFMLLAATDYARGKE